MAPSNKAATETDIAAPAAELRQVTLSYGASAPLFESLDFVVPSGAFRYLVGPSGAGKSSLLRLILLDGKPDAGEVRLFGEDTRAAGDNRLAVLRRNIGVVFQDFRLLDGMTLVDNVALPRLIAGADIAKSRKEAGELLDWVGLGDRAAAPPRTLSGGERQRAAIARAVISRPRLIVADEPTGSVDDTMAERLLTLFEELNRQGVAVVFATHSALLIERRPHPTIRLADGKTVLEGSA